MIVVNVSTLLPRLETLLGWQADIYALSEVRLSLSQQRSISRRALALGFVSLLSPSPPPSPGFLVPPGGVGLFARRPLSLRPFSLPDLHTWTSIGRLIVGCIPFKCTQLIIACIYGFPVSHPRHADNEAMFMQAFACLTKLTHPAVLVGDFNEVESRSQVLTLAYRLGFWKINSNKSTTRDKNGDIAQNQAIDHVFANHRCHDLGIQGEVDYSRWLSDHFPISCSFNVPFSLPLAWSLPKPLSLEHEALEDVPWAFKGKTFAEWSAASERWLAMVYQTKSVGKCMITTEPVNIRSVPTDPIYNLIRSAQKTLRASLLPLSPPSLRIKLARKCRLLGLSCEGDTQECIKQLDECLKNHVSEKAAGAIASWKRKVKS